MLVRLESVLRPAVSIRLPLQECFFHLESRHKRFVGDPAPSRRIQLKCVSNFCSTTDSHGLKSAFGRRFTIIAATMLAGPTASVRDRRVWKGNPTPLPRCI